jgi:Protein of unknown function (DUF3888)
MYKKIVIITMTTLLLCSLPIYAKTEQTIPCINEKYALIASLTPTISKVVDEIYKDKPGGGRQWSGAETEVLSIVQLYGLGGSYRVKVRVHTFVGAHNPPSGIVTITIDVGADGQKVVEYAHQGN